MTIRAWSRWMGLLGGALFLASTLPVARGAVYSWSGGGSNGWTDADMWNSGTVTWANGNQALFNGNGTFTVVLNSPVSAGGASPAMALANAPSNGTSTTVNFSGSETLTLTGGYFGVGWQTAGTAGNTATAVFNHSSGTIVASGGLEIGRFGTNGTYTMSGGSLEVGGFAFRIANNTYNSSGTVAPQGLLAISGGAVTSDVTVQVGAIGQSGHTANGTLTISGTGLLVAPDVVLSSGNFANGTVNLDGGTLQANSVSGDVSGSETGIVNFNGGTLRARTNNSTFVTGLTRANVRNGGATFNTDGFNVTIGQSLLHSDIDGDAAIDGGVTKTGAGRLTLSGNNTFTGGITVSGGTLALSGTNASVGTTNVTAGRLDVTGALAGTTSIGANATLGGDGTLAGATTILGIHAPGNSPGIQTFGAGLTYGSDSTLEWELIDNTVAGRGTAYDGVDVTGGTFSLTSGSVIDLAFSGTVDFQHSFWSADQEWLVVDLIGSTTAADANLFTLGSITGGANYSPSLGSFGVDRRPGSNSADAVYLTWVAVPEPATIVLAGIGMVGLMAFMRHRRSSLRR